MKYWIKTPGKFILMLLITVAIVLALSGCSGSTGVPGPMGQQGPPGVGVKEASINNNGHLVITLSNGQSIDAGNVVGTQPATTSPSGSTAISMADLFSAIQPVIVRIDVAGPGFSGFRFRDNY